MKHFRRWGAVYILIALFAGSWGGQAATMVPEEGWTKFWSATLENWQSEWLQLVFQAVLLLGAKHIMFQVDAQDLERIEAKQDAMANYFIFGNKEQYEADMNSIWLEQDRS